MAIETVKRVWEESEGVGLEISDYPEAPDCLQIAPVTQRCKEWFGTFSVTITPAFAIELGQALIEVGKAKLASKAKE
jgi:hypothetical protein